MPVQRRARHAVPYPRDIEKGENKMTPSLPLTISDYWDIAVRRKWLILGTICVCLAIAGLLCLVLPKTYRSTTLILVEDQKIPESYEKGIFAANIEGRLSMIK